MVNIIDLDKAKPELVNILQKAFQSCNLNFLIGSGCSRPALNILGSIEQEADKLYKQKKYDEADNIIAEFIREIVLSTKQLVENNPDENHKKTIKNYSQFLNNISLVLFERKSNILHKQAIIFSTNYDLFIEKAVEPYSENMALNDGFCRNPSLTNAYKYSPKMFFNTVSNTGNLYKYKVDLPSINLIKLHGSMNWQIHDDKIFQASNYMISANKTILSDKEYIDQYSIILPKKDKFNKTLLNQTYYDLLRIFANELDKENTLLITEGFSFADEHIFDLIKRALKNPTLIIIIFCYSKSELSEIKEKFSAFNNVTIVYSEKEKIDFEKYNSIIGEILPKKVEKPVYLVEIKKDESL